jgi:hypothetical protein
MSRVIPYELARLRAYLFGEGGNESATAERDAEPGDWR